MKTGTKNTTTKKKTFPVFRKNKVVYLPLSELTAEELNEMFENVSGVVGDHPKTAKPILEEIRREFLNRQYDPFLIENDIEGFVIDQLCVKNLEIQKNKITMSGELEKKIDCQSRETQKLISDMVWRYHRLIFEKGEVISEKERGILQRPSS